MGELMMKGGHGPTNSGKLDLNWGAFNHASHAHQVTTDIYSWLLGPKT